MHSANKVVKDSPLHTVVVVFVSLQSIGTTHEVTKQDVLLSLTLDGSFFAVYHYELRLEVIADVASRYSLHNSSLTVALGPKVQLQVPISEM